MGDVQMLVRRLGLGVKTQIVEAKSFEYLRIATARLGPAGLRGVSNMCTSIIAYIFLRFLSR